MERLPMPRRLWAILAVTFGVALSVLDGTIANVALPTIAHELGVSSADSIWVVNAYQLAIVVSLLSFSTLGDVVGYRRIYIGGLVFFTLSSVGCAFAGSLEMLIAMRVIQGFGGAAVVSINTSIIRIIYPRDSWGAAWASMPRWWPSPRWRGRRSRPRFFRWRRGTGSSPSIFRSASRPSGSACVSCRTIPSGSPTVASTGAIRRNERRPSGC